MKKKYSIGIVPGSFDPITVGHVDVIRRAAELCEKVFVAVMINAEKKYMFTLDERREIAEAACENFQNVKVISSDGMLFELAKKLSAEVIIKGVRNEKDREYELSMALGGGDKPAVQFASKTGKEYHWHILTTVSVEK